jgi:aryl-alcohol dehydrogenase-like predicted oxidoreductase
VPASLLGRTNQSFPPVWLSLSAALGGNPKDLAAAASTSGTVIDVTSSPALWGGLLRTSDCTFLYRGGEDIEVATDERHASDLLQAQLIQVLSCLGRPQIDFFCFKVRKGLEEFQINGALAALDEAKQDGLVKWIGLSSGGPALATLGAWQFHDAFDLLLVNRSHFSETDYATLVPLAAERRVGIVTTKPWNWGGRTVESLGEWGGETHDLARLRNLTQGFFGLSLKQALLNDLAKDHPVLVEVSSASDLQAALQAPSLPLPDGMDSLIQEYKAAFEVPA